MRFEHINESSEEEEKSIIAITDGEINELSLLLDAQEEGIPFDETRLYELEFLDRYCLGDQLSAAETEDLRFVLKRRDRFQRYTEEYNSRLELQEADEEIEYGRLYLLELVVRKRLGESLTSAELEVLDNFEALSQAGQGDIERHSSTKKEIDYCDLMNLSITVY
jgi:hypothetical protein